MAHVYNATHPSLSGSLAAHIDERRVISARAKKELVEGDASSTRDLSIIGFASGTSRTAGKPAAGATSIYSNRVPLETENEPSETLRRNQKGKSRGDPKSCRREEKIVHPLIFCLFCFVCLFFSISGDSVGLEIPKIHDYS